MQTFRAITRTRMFTPGFKLFAALSGFALTAAFVFGASSNAEFDQARDNLAEVILGPISLGWKGSVGNHAGYVVLIGMVLAAGFLAGLLVAFRDADPEAEAELVETDSVPLTRAPYGTSYWPIATAFAVGAMVLGLVTNMALFWAGTGVLVAVIGVWTFRAWAERATGDDETNLAIYNRFVDPIRLPFTALVVIGIVVLGMSRIILTVPDKNTSIAVFGGAAVIVFGVMVLLAFAPKLGKTALAGLIVLFGAVFVLGGVIGASRGERSFEHHGAGGEHGEGSGTGTEGHSEGEPAGSSSSEHGLAPATPSASPEDAPADANGATR